MVPIDEVEQIKQALSAGRLTVLEGVQVSRNMPRHFRGTRPRGPGST